MQISRENRSLAPLAQSRRAENDVDSTLSRPTRALVAPGGPPTIVRAPKFPAKDAPDRFNPRGPYAEQKRQEGRAGLFGRARHVGYSEMAADDLSLRGRHVHGRSGAGRGARACAPEGA